jgi:hypothetical protein
LDEATFPRIAVPGTFERLVPEPENTRADAVPDTLRPVKVPTDVMFGWEACVTTRAVVALATVPTMLEAWILDRVFAKMSVESTRPNARFEAFRLLIWFPVTIPAIFEI